MIRARTSITGVSGPAGGGVWPRRRPRTTCPVTTTDTPSGTISRIRPPIAVAYSSTRLACSIAWVKSTSTSPAMAVTVSVSGTTHRPSRRAGLNSPVITRPPSSRTGWADGAARSPVSSASSPRVLAEQARCMRSACSCWVSRPSLIASASSARTRSRSSSDARRSRGASRGLIDLHPLSPQARLQAPLARSRLYVTGLVVLPIVHGRRSDRNGDGADQPGTATPGPVPLRRPWRDHSRQGRGHDAAAGTHGQRQPVAGMGPVGEVRIVPDPDTFVVLPYAPGAGAMLADLVRPDGSPWEACPRTFLKQAIVEMAGEGYAVQAAFEPEFTLGRRESSPAGPSIPDRLIPVDDSLCYSATGFHMAHDFIMELVAALEAQDLTVEHYYPELGHGQHEVSVRHADALRAADNHVLYRETVRGVAFRRGLWASLAPKPIPDQAGNGTHLHVSLIDPA